jgi:hypothetical protein
MPSALIASPHTPDRTAGGSGLISSHGNRFPLCVAGNTHRRV